MSILGIWPRSMKHVIGYIVRRIVANAIKLNKKKLHATVQEGLILCTSKKHAWIVVGMDVAIKRSAHCELVNERFNQDPNSSACKSFTTQFGSRNAEVEISG